MVRFRKSMGFVSKNVAMGLPPIIDSIIEYDAKVNKRECPTCGSARGTQCG